MFILPHLKALTAGNFASTIFKNSALDLNFASTKSLIDSATGQNLVTFTRASSATFIDSAGTLQTAAVDVPRFDHNPTTGESLGLLVEEQRTNSIRNNTMVGAVAGTPGTPPTNWNQSNNTGLAANVVGTGTENGITYIDFRINGTTTGTGQTNIVFETATGVPALTGQAWTLTNYIKVQAGSTANFTNIRLVLQENTSAGVAVVSGTQDMTIPVTPLGSYRPSFTRTLSGGATVAALMPFIQCNINTGLAVDITLRIGLPQLELGAFATSAIPTSTAAATRSADVASITGANFSSWYRQDEGTVFAAYDQPAVGGSIVVIDDETANNSINLFSVSVANQRVSSNMLVASANQGRMDAGGTFTANVLNRAALAVSASGRGLSCNGSAVSTSANPSSMPTLSRLAIQGDSSFVVQKGGTIRRLTYWPQRLPNSTLQAITQ
jgi:hypothetical protein